MKTKKQNFKTQSNRFIALLFLLALVTGTAGCGPKGLTIVNVECEVIDFSSLLTTSSYGPFRKVLTNYWSDGTVTKDDGRLLADRPSCP
jgi:hypothetical protein